MGEIISILNQKGGCGKTTTAVKLSTALALFDNKYTWLIWIHKEMLPRVLGWKKPMLI